MSSAADVSNGIARGRHRRGMARPRVRGAGADLPAPHARRLSGTPGEQAEDIRAMPQRGSTN
ncbi:MAG TPA: hypothetical protein PKD75_10665 [Tepidiformaceae bacterium]|nr:hypothetical protein [Tepidiformaceae bacterium]